MNNTTKITRDVGIDILKCLAAIIITYSHLELQFGEYAALATGGSFGDCLFFFCSGYTLLLSKKQLNFFNWYKNRINRIYPTIFAWAVLCYILFAIKSDIFYILTKGGGFFVTCIMLFYIVFYPLRGLRIKYLLIIGGVIFAICYISFFFLDHTDKDIMYLWKWSMYFLPMLMGAIFGKAKKDGTDYPMKNLNMALSGLLLLTSAVAYYVLMYITEIGTSMDFLHPFIIVPQLGVVYGFYRLCNSNFANELYNKKWTHAIIMFVGGLCLEIYIVQPPLLHTFPMTEIFPLNILVIFAMIIACAYILKVLSRVWQQTFREAEYDWKEIVKLY